MFVKRFLQNVLQWSRMMCESISKNCCTFDETLQKAEKNVVDWDKNCNNLYFILLSKPNLTNGESKPISNGRHSIGAIQNGSHSGSLKSNGLGEVESTQATVPEVLPAVEQNGGANLGKKPIKRNTWSPPGAIEE